MGKSVENVLAGIHQVVFQITEKTTADKSLAKDYEEAMGKAETVLKQMENQLEEKTTLSKTLSDQMKNIETDRLMTLHKIENLTKDLELLQLFMFTRENIYYILRHSKKMRHSKKITNIAIK